MGFSEKFKRVWNFIFVPTSIKPLTFVLLIENMLSLYRNIYYYRNIYFRIAIYVRLLLDILIAVGCLVLFSSYILPFAQTSSIISFYLNIFNSMYMILAALYHSRRFNKLLLLIEANNLYFTSDNEYRGYLERLNRKIKYGFLIYTFILVSFHIILNWKRPGVTTTGSDIAAFCTINRTVSDYRCVFEYIALYSILCVLAEQVKCITRALTKTKISIAVISEQSHDESFSETKMEIREFGELSSVFSNIKDCSKLFNRIFGPQLILMLGLATSYCIMFLYRMAFISVKGYPDVQSLLVNVINLSLFFILLLMLSSSAQRKQNNVNELRQQLGKLLINYTTSCPNYKATKDLLRLVSTRAVSTETFGSIPVDMSLIPTFIMFITSYTVIALQFNNIV